MQVATRNAQAINRTIETASTELSRRLSEAGLPSTNASLPSSYTTQPMELGIRDLKVAQKVPEELSSRISPLVPPLNMSGLLSNAQTARLALDESPRTKASPHIQGPVVNYSPHTKSAYSSPWTRPRLENENELLAQSTMLNGNAKHLGSKIPASTNLVIPDDSDSDDVRDQPQQWWV